MPPPPDSNLQVRAANVAARVLELNDQMASVRSKLFGDGATPSKAGAGTKDLPSMAETLGDLEQLVAEANGQASSILNRL